MPIHLPPIIEGVAEGNADAWKRASDILHAYFVTDHNLSHTFFTLRGLDDDPNTINALDVVAILAMDIGGFRGQRHALMTDDDGRIGELLALIPDNLDLVDASDELLADDGPLGALWELLTDTQTYRLKPKVATALLARKRPRLCPLILPLQREVLGLDNNLIETMRELAQALRGEDGRLAHQLHYVNTSAQIPEELSSLQLLSALVYMDHSLRKKEEKAHRERLAAEKAERKKEEKRQKKQQKKLDKIKAKERDAKARKEEKQQRQQLEEKVGKANPISTEAFKLRESAETDDQFTFPQRSKNE